MKFLKKGIYASTYLYFLAQLRQGLNGRGFFLAISYYGKKRILLEFLDLLVSLGIIEIAGHDRTSQSLEKKKEGSKPVHWIKIKKLNSGTFLKDIRPLVVGSNLVISVKIKDLIYHKRYFSNSCVVISTGYGLLTQFECLFLGVGGIIICRLCF